MVPIVNVHSDRAMARAGIDVPALAESTAGSKFWAVPSLGSFSTIEDLNKLLHFP